MKFHRNLALAVITATHLVFEEKQVASRALERLFSQNPKWGKRDRAFVAEITYEIVRWRRLFAHAAQSEDPWKLLAVQLMRSGYDLPEWNELDPIATETRRQDLSLPRAIRESVPDWLDALGSHELGDHWDAEITALNQEAPVILRANTLKVTRDELQARLQTEGVETATIEYLPDALRLQTRRSISTLGLYKDGYFEIQDAASQLVAPFMLLESGMKVLDACAGAGGKSLHIAALMKNRGHIVSSDIESEKLTELRRRSSRAGVSCLETKTPQTVATHGQSFDRVLIDAPCSGLGTLRRQPDLKWRLTPEFFNEIQEKQRGILMTYAPTVKNGGSLVYATCSILPRENERQVEWFLSKNPGFELRDQKSILTSETGYDGFYMARLKRK